MAAAASRFPWGSPHGMHPRKPPRRGAGAGGAAVGGRGTAGTGAGVDAAGAAGRALKSAPQLGHHSGGWEAASTVIVVPHWSQLSVPITDLRWSLLPPPRS